MPLKNMTQSVALGEPFRLTNQTGMQASTAAASDPKVQSLLNENISTPVEIAESKNQAALLNTDTGLSPNGASQAAPVTNADHRTGHIDLFELLEIPFKLICDIQLFLIGPDKSKMHAAHCESHVPLTLDANPDEVSSVPAAPKVVSIMDANPKTGHIELFELMEIPFRVVCDLELSITGSSEASYTLQYDIPDGKLFYPEPFIASPTYHHTDLSFLHIFQYWYWL